MTGFLGLPSGAQKRDTNNLNNVFNFGMDTAKRDTSSGDSNLGTAGAYFTRLLTGGRAATATNSAPAVNAVQDKADAVRKQEATSGTSRSGGTAEANREAGAGTNKTIDDIINENLMGGRSEAAKGLTAVGGTQSKNALEALKTGADAADDAEKGDTQQAKQQAQFGQDMAGAAMKMFFGA